MIVRYFFKIIVLSKCNVFYYTKFGLLSMVRRSKINSTLDYDEPIKTETFVFVHTVYPKQSKIGECFSGTNLGSKLSNPARNLKIKRSVVREANTNPQIHRPR